MNILLMSQNIIAANGAVRTLWSTASNRERQKGETFCYTVEKLFIFIASLLQTGWSPKIRFIWSSVRSGDSVTRSAARNSIMPEELLRSSLFASFRKYILLMAGFPMATMKSVQEKKALKTKLYQEKLR